MWLGRRTGPPARRLTVGAVPVNHQLPVLVAFTCNLRKLGSGESSGAGVVGAQVEPS